MTRPAKAIGARFEPYGLSAFTFRREPEGGRMDDLRVGGCHTHLELEIHCVESGSITLDLGGREVRLVPGELAAFWGGVPHRDIDPEPPVTVYHVAQVPIVNVLAWAGSAELLDRLLAGELVISVPRPDERTVDTLAFTRWVSDLRSPDIRLRSAVEMEMHARLLRLLAASTPASRIRKPPGSATATLVATAIQYVTRHFVEPFTVEDVARAVGRHHDHLMSSFRRVCGLTLWEYVIRLRLSEAQRLLATTDLPILAVCHRSGFSSVSRMYEAFHRYNGQTPSAYRKEAS
ncbi:helix-turn-helix domain-containing protein [Jiangella endophytica]|uniref:helix-turn-helix domain-containing protein n=1 Tax=Jiangella endophytica TaxID=1623398 RepID=UPI001300B138|nr:helix-turn-helix domain-containing protein [Jiangella endophytica]